MTIVQAPAGASLEYTTEIAQAGGEDPVRGPGGRGGVLGARASASPAPAPNNGMMFARLQDCERAARTTISRSTRCSTACAASCSASPARMVVAVRAAGDPGLSVFGGFQFEVLDQTGGDITGLAGATSGAGGAGQPERPASPGAVQPFRADDPQLVVDIDRDRARSLGLPLREVTDALQVFLGSQYVNDFDFNNRAYRVYVQADQRFRAEPADLGQLYARSQTGEMVPLDTVVRLRETTAPQVISHFNLFRSAEITGVRRAGRELGPGAGGDGAARARETLPPGFDFAWAGQSLEEIKAGGAGRLHLRAQHPDRLSRARGAVRELDPAVHHPARRAAGGVRRAQRAVAARLRQRRVLPGRPGDARRPGGEELHPDRRVRRAAARARACRSSTRRSSRRASACGRF